MNNSWILKTHEKCHEDGMLQYILAGNSTLYHLMYDQFVYASQYSSLKENPGPWVIDLLEYEE